MDLEDRDHACDLPAAEAATTAARRLCERRQWQAAHDLLAAADARGELDAAGLELQAECARWLGERARAPALLERAHAAYADDARGALRTALALCHTHTDACESALAAAWWHRADELSRGLPEGAEHGLHAWFEGRVLSETGDAAGHERCARRALDIAGRFGDRNVEALARIDLAHLATYHGRTTEALDHLDRATALALGGEIGILETGIVFCNAIFTCRARGEWGRARTWTETANRWVSRVQVSYFPGLCRVHRAEVLRVRGELAQAEEECAEAVRMLAEAIPRWSALGWIELGEVRRRRGDLSGALEAFRGALTAGWEPQPGLALVQLEQGDPQGAHRALVRYMQRKVPPMQCEDRATLRGAQVRVAVAAGDFAVAEAALAELAALADGDSLPWDRATRWQAAGALAFGRGDVAAAVVHLGQARELWAELQAPYERASTCMLLGRALAVEGSSAAATLELEAARALFHRIGAVRGFEECEALLGGELDRRAGGAADGGGSLVDGASLRNEGEVWSLTFAGTTVRLRDAKGPRYLARLLAEPGAAIPAMELAGVVAGGDLGEVLDAEARADYRRRIEELQVEIETAANARDTAGEERCRTELDALNQALVSALGFGGRARRTGDPGERARQSVTKALRGTIRRIGQSHGPLGRYLENTIRTGQICRFEPDPGRPVVWSVDG